MYFHRNCIMTTNKLMQNVPANSVRKLPKMKESSRLMSLISYHKISNTQFFKVQRYEKFRLLPSFFAMNHKKLPTSDF